MRQYHEDREISAWLLLDLSPSQDFGTVLTLKRHLLIDLTTLLARLLTRHGNRIGAILYGSKVEKIIPAMGGRLQVLRLTDTLVRHRRLMRAPSTDLSSLLEAARRMIKRRSLVFVVSDFHSVPGWEKPLRLLAQRHEVLGVRVADPRESKLPDLGLVTFEDAETGEQLVVDTHNERFRQRFEEAARRRELEVNEVFRNANVDMLSLSTEDDLVKGIIGFAAMRKQRTTQSRVLA